MAIKSKVTLDTSGAEAEASRASKAISDKFNTGGIAPKGLGSGFFSGAESGLTKLSSGINLVRTAWGTLSSLIEQTDAFNDLQDGVASVLPPLMDVNVEMQKLHKLAESPGLEFASVARAHERFLSLGKSSETSMNIIREIGNALQLSGKDPEALTAIVEALTKMDDKGVVNIKTIQALTGESAIFKQVFDGGFGTDSLQKIEAMSLSAESFLDKFTVGLSKLATAQKDANDTLGDFSDDAKMAAAGAVDAGTGLLNWWVGAMKGEARALTEAFGGKWTLDDPVAPRQQVTESPEEKATREKKLSEEVAEAQQAKFEKLQQEAELQEELLQSKATEAEYLRQAGEATGEQKRTLEAMLADQKGYTYDLQLKLNLQKRQVELAEKEKISLEQSGQLIKAELDNVTERANKEQERASQALGFQKEAEASAKRIADLEKEGVEATKKKAFIDKEMAQAAERAAQKASELKEKEARNAADIGKRDRDAEIQDAENHGHKGKARRLRKKADIEDKAREYGEMGMDEGMARRYAERDVQLNEDAETRSRTGRSKVRGGQFGQSFGGIDGVKFSGLAAGQDRIGDQNFAKTDWLRNNKRGATTALTAEERAKATSTWDRRAELPKEAAALTKGIAELVAQLPALVSAAKKYNAANLNP